MTNARSCDVQKWCFEWPRIVDGVVSATTSVVGVWRWVVGRLRCNSLTVWWVVVGDAVRTRSCR